MNAPTPRARERKLPDYIKINEDGSATVQLAFPVSIGGVKTGSVTLRRPKVRDRLQAAEGRTSNEAIEMALFGNLIGWAPEELEELDLVDYARVQEAFRGFLSSQTVTKSDAQS